MHRVEIKTDNTAFAFCRFSRCRLRNFGIGFPILALASCDNGLAPHTLGDLASRQASVDGGFMTASRQL